MKKLLFIYNTYAGKGRIGYHLSAIQEKLCAAGHTVTIHPTKGAGDAAEIAREKGEKYDRIVCCGGDGTMHEVITGLLHLPPEKRPPVGYIPAGTTNDFGKNLNLPASFADKAGVAANGILRPIDIGHFNDQCFVYIAAFGAFTDVSYSTPQQFKSMFGHLAYLMEAATRIGSIKAYHITVEYDGEMLKGDFAYGMVTNTVSFGGFKGMPSTPVVLDDGLFEVVLIRQPTNPMHLQSIFKNVVQMKMEEDDLVVILRAGHIKIICDEALPWTLDGEYGGTHNVAEIINDNRAVTVAYGK